MLSVALGWSLVVAFLGGLACGWCISHFAEFGALSLAACGALAGYVSHKITRGPSRIAAVSQVAAASLAFFVAGTCWLHWNTLDGEPSWWVAMCLWPFLVRDYQFFVLVGGVSAAYGAWCAYGYATSPDPRPTQPTAPITPLL
ncbi:MAG: hypothetical protein B7Z73_11425 [Planctomycetia bacterium 21-64-5]|nr:MAG: hypothetical protein B7Z73_11425 [Planctomycetia bacterium 21-64-5]